MDDRDHFGSVLPMAGTRKAKTPVREREVGHL
jgi:hypothetical protein